jgi:hypothetical protein
MAIIVCFSVFCFTFSYSILLSKARILKSTQSSPPQEKTADGGCMGLQKDTENAVETIKVTLTNALVSLLFGWEMGG